MSELLSAVQFETHFGELSSFGEYLTHLKRDSMSAVLTDDVNIFSDLFIHFCQLQMRTISYSYLSFILYHPCGNLHASPPGLIWPVKETMKLKNYFNQFILNILFLTYFLFLKANFFLHPPLVQVAFAPLKYVLSCIFMDIGRNSKKKNYNIFSISRCLMVVLCTYTVQPLGFTQTLVTNTYSQGQRKGYIL